MTKTISIALKKPHCEKQRLMVEHPGSVVAFCGRRFGKTDAYVQRLFYWMQRQAGLYWWVGLSWRSASMKRAWRETTEIARKLLRAMGLQERHYINRSSYEIRIPGLGEIWFRTAENPASLAGEGIYGAVVDEFSLMDEIVWTEYLQGTLLDHGGWAAFGGVPKGINWASMLWHDAAIVPGWLQVHATSYDNPFIDHDALEEVKQNTPDDTFRQEYMAEILEDGAVFNKVKQAATATRQEYAQHNYPSHPKHQYVMGVDLARLQDYTVIMVVDATTREQCYLERFNKISWEYQLARIKDVARLFNPVRIRMDATGVGDPIVEQAQREMDSLVEGVQFTQPNKAKMIEALKLAFDKQTIRICNEPVLVGELQSLQATRTALGLRYAAPSGYHDDCVMALALAWDAVSQSAPVRVEKRR
jgi:hypothetical protein